MHSYRKSHLSPRPNLEEWSRCRAKRRQRCAGGGGQAKCSGTPCGCRGGWAAGGVFKTCHEERLSTQHPLHHLLRPLSNLHQQHPKLLIPQLLPYRIHPPLRPAPSWTLYLLEDLYGTQQKSQRHIILPSPEVVEAADIMQRLAFLPAISCLADGFHRLAIVFLCLLGLSLLAVDPTQDVEHPAFPSAVSDLPCDAQCVL